MKDTCKQAIFRRRYQESQEELRISGQQEIKKRENWSFSTECKQSCRASNPFPTDYDPDLEIKAELDEEQATYYQSQIDILHCIVESGRIDIATEVSLMASHVALPRKGTPTDSISYICLPEEKTQF